MRFFTKEEDKFLLENYLKIPAKRMSVMLGRSESSARQRMALLGICVPPEVSERFKKQSQYKKGSTPENKGKKMSAELYAKCSRTMFTKGHKPHNTKFDGHERVNKEGYIEVRIREGKYVLKHRVIWEKCYGKIPKGMLVVFRNGNKRDFRLSNFELITRKENMKRNSVHNLPKPIALAVQLRGALNRQINKKLKQISK